MEERRFDALAKSLARPVGRRGVLKGIVAAVLGSVVAGGEASASKEPSYRGRTPDDLCLHQCPTGPKAAVMACRNACYNCIALGGDFYQGECCAPISNDAPQFINGTCYHICNPGTYLCGDTCCPNDMCCQLNEAGQTGICGNCCTYDSDCGLDACCYNGTCVSDTTGLCSCTYDSDCSPGSCCKYGYCTSSEFGGCACTYDSDCAPLSVCYMGTCSRLLSDRDVKADFAGVDPQAILDGVLSLPLSTWRYRGEDHTIRHLGPMAQDFAAAFGLGDSERHIHVVDGQGVTLAAIQGLAQQLQAQAARVAQLEAALAQLTVCRPTD